MLGHALDMKAIHGGKAKNEETDSHKAATLPSGQLRYQKHRQGLAEAFDDLALRATIEADLALADRYDSVLAELEHTIEAQAQVQ